MKKKKDRFSEGGSFFESFLDRVKTRLNEKGEV